MQVKPMTFEYKGKKYAVKEREDGLHGCPKCCFFDNIRDCYDVCYNCTRSDSAYITEAEEQKQKNRKTKPKN